MLLLSVINGIYEAKISLGELIQIILAPSILLLAFAGWVIHQWHINHPFRAFYQKDIFDLSPVVERRQEPDYRDMWTSPRQVEFLYRVSPNKGTRLSRIGVRIVLKRWVGLSEWQRSWILWRPRLWKWENINPEHIHIKSIEDEDVKRRRCPSGQKFETWQDLAGGYWAEYTPPFLRSVEDSIWLYIIAQINQPGEYHISFQGQIIDERRGYVRRSLIFEDVRPYDERS